MQQQTTDTETEEAFLDVAANTLAIIVIVTVFSLTVVKSDQPSSRDPRAIPEPPITYRVGDRSGFTPISRFIVFAEGRHYDLDVDGLLGAVDDNAQAPPIKAETEQGRFVLSALPIPGSDISYYTLAISPAPEFIDGLPLFDDQRIESMIAEYEADWRKGGVAPTFLVYGSGLDAFSRLHEKLLTSRMPWRWNPLGDGDPIRIQRTQIGFKSLTTYW